MRREKFLSELEKHLGRAPETERLSVLNYYREILDERGIGCSDPVPPEFGPPRQIAFEILRDIELSAWTQREQAGKRPKRSVFFLIVLSILALPLALPLSLTLLALIFTLIVSVAALLFSLFVCSAAFFVAGLFTLIAANFLNPLGALLGFGLMLTSAGAFLLSISFVRFLLRALRRLLERRADKRLWDAERVAPGSSVFSA